MARLIAIGFLLSTFLAASCLQPPAEILPHSPVLELENWEARVVPETLKVFVRRGEAGEEIQIAAAKKSYPVQNLEIEKAALRWTIPDLAMNVEVRAEHNRIRLRFQTTREMKFTWPVSGLDPAMKALIYPDGEGLYIPLDDPFWRLRFPDGACRDTHGGLSMPFWSYHLGGGTVTYLVLSDLQTELCFSNLGDRLSTYAVHDFRQRDGLPAYEILIWLGGASPISPAREYKDWLKEHGEYVSLDEKINKNPEAAKLLGATHAYLYGDGKTPQLLKELQGLGIDRVWLGYDQDPQRETRRVGAKFIAEAKRLGFLVGPYDSFANIQNPGTADAPNALWDAELYRTGCIINADGKPREGFAGRGCELSSEALARAEPTKHYIETRVKKHLATGINSYFLDVDGAGELFDDYSPDHPMTPREDRLNRLRRMRYISQEQKMVLGSESVVSWAAPVVHFSHGTLSVHNDVLWPLMRNRNKFGGWWPRERPAIFFKPVEVEPEFARAKYDPSYRLPLFQAAFHESVVVTDRWELSPVKFPQLVQTRALIELLYNVPSIWSLDLREVRKNGERLAAHHRFFSPMHRRVGAQPLTEFRWLTPDRRVQQTRFGSTITMTANFSDDTFESISPMCIEAHRHDEGRREVYCPAP